MNDNSDIRESFPVKRRNINLENITSKPEEIDLPQVPNTQSLPELIFEATPMKSIFGLLDNNDGNVLNNRCIYYV